MVNMHTSKLVATILLALGLTIPLSLAFADNHHHHPHHKSHSNRVVYYNYPRVYTNQRIGYGYNPYRTTGRMTNPYYRETQSVRGYPYYRFSSSDRRRLQQLMRSHPQWFNSGYYSGYGGYPYSSAVYGASPYNVYPGGYLPSGYLDQMYMLPTSTNSLLGLPTSNLRMGVLGNNVVMYDATNRLIYDVLNNLY